MTTELIAPITGTGRHVEVNGVVLYYQELGEGPPLLLLHGGIMDHQSWGNQFSALAAQFRVIAPDTRGHGRSTDSNEPFSYALFADDVVELCRRLRVEKAHVVGFSDGGCTGIILATEQPDLVDRLVLIGTPYNTSNYPDGALAQNAQLTPEALYAAVSPEFAEVVRKAEGQYPTDDAWRAFFGKLVSEMWTREPAFALERLRGIHAPTLILHAEKEQFFGRDHSEAMARTIPTAKLVVVPNATHTSAQENPQFVNEVILDFLSMH
jgi:pimeloyl-ACP methyl ester carboxylesterase